MEIEFIRFTEIMKEGGGPGMRRKSQRGIGNV